LRSRRVPGRSGVAPGLTPRPSRSTGRRSPHVSLVVWPSSFRFVVRRPLCGDGSRSSGVVEGLVGLARNPQPMQQHRELARHGHHRSFLCILAAPRSYLLSVASEVRVSSEETQDVVSTAHHEPPQHLVAFLGDAFLGVPFPRLIPGRHESQISPYAATLFEAVGVLHGEHEGKRGKRSDPFDLAQELGLWVMLFRDGFQLALIVADALCQRSDLCSKMGPRADMSASGMCSGALL
jgi:hypothetical protein